jgi:hypothetical protein
MAVIEFESTHVRRKDENTISITLMAGRPFDGRTIAVSVLECSLETALALSAALKAAARRR